MTEKRVPGRTGSAVKANAAAKTVKKSLHIAGAKKTHASTTKATKRAARAAGRAAGPVGVVEWKPDLRAGQIVRALGNKRAAQLLGVSESQPSRWRNAQEVPSPQVAPALVDLDHIIARLQLVWDGAVIGDWLEGPNGFLEGARPIDVLLTHGSVPVLEAIEAEASGAYA